MHRNRSRRRSGPRLAAAVLGLLALLATTTAFGVSEAPTRGWARRFDGPTADDDEFPYDIAVDALGRIYIAGSSEDATSSDFLTVAYSPEGSRRWVRRFNPSGMIGVARAVEVGPSGAVYVAGTTDDGWNAMTTVRYGAAGNRLWARRWDGGHGEDANDLAIGGNERVFVTGSTWDGAERDVLTIAYSKSGRRLWLRTWDLRGISDDIGLAVAGAADGAAYVLARAFCTMEQTSCDFLILKYHPRGGLRWVRAWDGGYDDWPGGIGVDSAGNVYVSGTTRNAGGDTDLVTFSYSGNGRLRWEQRYDGPAGGDEWIGGMQVTSGGVTYVTASSDGYSNDDDIVTIRYGSRGRETWVRRYGERTGTDESAWGLAVDSEGNVVVVGSKGPEGSRDAITLKYNRRGTHRWTRVFDRPAGEDNGATAVAIDPAGWSTVTGFTGVAYTDLLTIHYGP